MIKEIRMYWRLRPYIKRIKELAHMKLSWNVVVQIIVTLMQAYNQVSDLLPEKWKPGAAVIMGAIQGIVAMISHFSNPDGSSAKLPYEPPKTIKLPSVFLMVAAAGILCGMFSMPAAAQDSQGFSLGVALGNQINPMGWGTYDKQLSERVWSYSGYDAIPFWEEGAESAETGFKKILHTKFRFNAFTGLATRIVKINNLSLFLFGAGGLVTTGETTTGSGKYGGFGHYSLGKGWGVIAGGEGNYSPISGTDGMFRFGFRYGIGGAK